MYIGAIIIPFISFIIIAIVIIRIVISSKNKVKIFNEELNGENNEFIDLIKNGLNMKNNSKPNHKCEYCGTVHDGVKCPNCGATNTK